VIIKNTMLPLSWNELTRFIRQNRIVARKYRTVEIGIRHKAPLLLFTRKQMQAPAVKSAPSSIACHPLLIFNQLHHTHALKHRFG